MDIHSFCGREGRSNQAATGTWTLIIEGDPNETILAPASTPRILNDHVVLTIFVAVADSQHGMIVLSGALRAVKNTTSVAPEVVISSRKRDSDRLLLKCSLHSVTLLWLHIHVAIGLPDNEWVRILTGLVNSFIRIRGLTLYALSRCVDERKLLSATIAACVSISGVTVDELLLRELV